MGLRINTNIASINANRQLSGTTHDLQQSLERLSSGSRINKSGDDAAGLAISENLKAQIRGLRQAIRNAADGVSLVQVTEGGLNEISNILIRLRELSVQSASDTISDVERSFTNREFQLLKDEVQRIANTTNFNGTPVLNGSQAIVDIQVGTRNTQDDRLSYDTRFANASLESIGIAEIASGTKLDAQQSLGKIDKGIEKVQDIRASLGAMQNRLQSTIRNISVYDENLSAANSRIRDADIAEESSTNTKLAILQQAGISVLSQANTTQRLALKLLDN
jgi:flagellin